jgi:hypothetical protein
MTHDDVSPWFFRGVYLFGLALFITAAIDLLTTVWPMHPEDIGWRYGFLGLMAGYLQTPTIGLLLIIGAAIWEENGPVLRVSGVVGLLAALGLVMAMGMFGLDVMQMRELRAEEMRSSVLAGGMFQEVKYFIAAFVLAFVGYGALKTAKTAGSKATGRSRRSPGIVSAPS